MRILRHEAGHAIDNAYRCAAGARASSSSARRRRPTPSTTRRSPYSKQLRAAPRPLVRAEPSRRGLRRDLRRVADAATRSGGRATPDWPALKKLEYVDALMREIGRAAAARRQPPRASIRCRGSARRCASTTARSASTTASTIPNFYDRDLRRLFSDAPEYARRPAPRPRFLAPHPQGGPRARSRAGPASTSTPSTRCSTRSIERCRELNLRLADDRGRDQARLHRPAHRADDELPAQRPAPGGAVRRRCASSRSMHDDLVPPDDVHRASTSPTAHWKTEFDVTVHAARPRPRGASRSASATTSAIIRRAVDEWKPHIVFNLLEDFHDVPIFDQNVVSYLELLRVPYTGCNPRGLMLARDKALSKKLLAYHRIPVPEFAVFRIGRPVAAAEAADVPADRQVADAGGVDRHLAGVGRRRRREARASACASSTRASAPTPSSSSYIDGRELYVGVLGNQRAAGVPGLGAALHQDAGRRAADRHRPREVERASTRRSAASRPAPAQSCPTRQSRERIQHALQARLPGARAERLRAHRPAPGRGGHASTCSRPTRTRSSPTARTSPSRPSAPASPTTRCCSGSSPSGCAGARSGSG